MLAALCILSAFSSGVFDAAPAAGAGVHVGSSRETWSPPLSMREEMSVLTIRAVSDTVRDPKRGIKEAARFSEKQCRRHIGHSMSSGLWGPLNANDSDLALSKGGLFENDRRDRSPERVDRRAERVDRVVIDSGPSTKETQTCW